MSPVERIDFSAKDSNRKTALQLAIQNQNPFCTYLLDIAKSRRTTSFENLNDQDDIKDPISIV